MCALVHCLLSAAFGRLRTVVTGLRWCCARGAAGGARRGLMLERSGAERADYPVVLTRGSGRRTHYAPWGRCVRTSAARMMTKCAARTDPRAALGAPEIAPTGLRLPRRWVGGVRSCGEHKPCRQAWRVAAPGGWLYSRMLQSHAHPPRWSRQPHGAPQRHLRATASSTARTPAALARDAEWRQPTPSVRNRPGAGAPSIDLDATLPTPNLKLQRLLRSRQIARSCDRVCCSHSQTSRKPRCHWVCAFPWANSVVKP